MHASRNSARPGSKIGRRSWNSNATPLSPYRVIRDLMASVDVANTVITHDAGSPRDELSPFWQTTAPHTYIGWGKTTQLGYGLGLAMGAKIANPEKLCINVWGDAAIGMTGMDFETAARVQDPGAFHPFQQFLDGDGKPDHEVVDGQISLHRHLRQLRGVRQSAWRLWRAHHRAGRYRSGDQARHQGNARRHSPRCSNSSRRPKRSIRPSATPITRDPTLMIRFGIGGWTFKEWRGTFFPKDVPAKRELEFASAQAHDDRDQRHVLSHANAGELREMVRRDAGGFRLFGQGAALHCRQEGARRNRRADRCVS